MDHQTKPAFLIGPINTLYDAIISHHRRLHSRKTITIITKFNYKVQFHVRVFRIRQHCMRLYAFSKPNKNLSSDECTTNKVLNHCEERRSCNKKTLNA
jgi:hypothetical protein